MAGYLEGYGVDDVRRSRLFWRLILSLVLLLIIGCALYFGLRSYPAKRKVNVFVEDLRKKDYRAAYDLWGCTPTSPCKDYTFQKFMEDWGPQAIKNPGAATIAKTRYCGPGVIVTLGFGAGSRDVPLWYQRSDGTLGFAPWPVCAPQPKAYQ